MSRRAIIGVLAVTLAAITGVVAFSDREEAPAPPSETLRLVVDISDRELHAIVEGEVVMTHPVTVGSAAHPTPLGSYHIDWIVWNPSWNPPDSDWARGKQRVGPGPHNPMGRVKLRFKAPTFYVHGTRDVWDLGEAASHGCVRVSNADALKVARLAMEHGGEARPPSWFTRVINAFRDTREVSLSRPVPIEIRQ